MLLKDIQSKDKLRLMAERKHGVAVAHRVLEREEEIETKADNAIKRAIAMRRKKNET